MGSGPSRHRAPRRPPPPPAFRRAGGAAWRPVWPVAARGGTLAGNGGGEGARRAGSRRPFPPRRPPRGGGHPFFIFCGLPLGRTVDGGGDAHHIAGAQPSPPPSVGGSGRGGCLCRPLCGSFFLPAPLLDSHKGRPPGGVRDAHSGMPLRRVRACVFFLPPRPSAGSGGAAPRPAASSPTERRPSLGAARRRERGASRRARGRSGSRPSFRVFSKKVGPFSNFQPDLSVLHEFPAAPPCVPAAGRECGALTARGRPRWRLPSPRCSSTSPHPPPPPAASALAHPHSWRHRRDDALLLPSPADAAAGAAAGGPPPADGCPPDPPPGVLLFSFVAAFSA